MSFTKKEFLANVGQIKIQDYKFKKLSNNGCVWEKKEVNRYIRIGLSYHSSQFQILLQNPWLDINFPEFDNLVKQAYQGYSSFNTSEGTFHGTSLLFTNEGINHTAFHYFNIESDVDFGKFLIEYSKVVNLVAIPLIDRIQSISDIAEFLENMELEKMFNYIGSGGSGMIKIPMIFQMTNSSRFEEIRDKCYQYAFKSKDLNSIGKMHFEVFRNIFKIE